MPNTFSGFSPLHFANPWMKHNRRETFKVGHNREELGVGSHPVEITPSDSTRQEYGC
jgi:hypothetical protein